MDSFYTQLSTGCAELEASPWNDRVMDKWRSKTETTWFDTFTYYYIGIFLHTLCFVTYIPFFPDQAANHHRYICFGVHPSSNLCLTKKKHFISS